MVSIRVVSAEIVRDGRYLLVQRAAHAVLPLLWEFPGGKVREGESDEDAIHRALAERIGCTGTVGPLLMDVVHGYDGYDLTLAVYRCAIEGEPCVGNIETFAWVGPDAFGDYTFPGADQKTIDALLEG
ncbi:MAG: (deoxy)nucleoside triphosphate pyrophosphohydrolase [Myxococcales bacterium]|nr:(deoxy)nucleoside triphosphate pyrophosphohydrolase [Myxococcales bacterium]MCB9669779.1 (deoxy)nucleoside triphosphate pyrophosphohydrolase [Alphaproteobacteria bacterium]